jgi:hypothetical protein
MDLLNLDTRAASDNGAAMEVKHPVTGDVVRQDPPEGAPEGTLGAPVTITLAGQDSSTYKKARNAQVTKRLAKRNPGKITGEEAEAEALELLVAATLGWDGISLGSNEPLAFTPGNVRRLYETLPAIREQAAAFVDDRANFLTK